MDPKKQYACLGRSCPAILNSWILAREHMDSCKLMEGETHKKRLKESAEKVIRLTNTHFACLASSCRNIYSSWIDVCNHMDNCDYLKGEIIHGRVKESVEKANKLISNGNGLMIDSECTSFEQELAKETDCPTVVIKYACLSTKCDTIFSGWRGARDHMGTCIHIKGITRAERRQRVNESRKRARTILMEQARSRSHAITETKPNDMTIKYACLGDDCIQIFGFWEQALDHMRRCDHAKGMKKRKMKESIQKAKDVSILMEQSRSRSHAITEAEPNDVTTKFACLGNDCIRIFGYWDQALDHMNRCDYAKGIKKRKMKESIQKALDASNEKERVESCEDNFSSWKQYKGSNQPSIDTPANDHCNQICGQANFQESVANTNKDILPGDTKRAGEYLLDNYANDNYSKTYGQEKFQESVANTNTDTLQGDTNRAHEYLLDNYANDSYSKTYGQAKFQESVANTNTDTLQGDTYRADEYLLDNYANDSYSKTYGQARFQDYVENNTKDTLSGNTNRANDYSLDKHSNYYCNQMFGQANSKKSVINASKDTLLVDTNRVNDYSLEKYTCPSSNCNYVFDSWYQAQDHMAICDRGFYESRERPTRISRQGPSDFAARDKDMVLVNRSPNVTKAFGYKDNCSVNFTRSGESYLEPAAKRSKNQFDECVPIEYRGYNRFHN